MAGRLRAVEEDAFLPVLWLLFLEAILALLVIFLMLLSFPFFLLVYFFLVELFLFPRGIFPPLRGENVRERISTF